jgi:hypothetical protein
MIRTLTLALSTIVFFSFSSVAQISVMAFSKDEGLNEKNISKPRIFIENTGSVPISDFYYYYYFTTEDGYTPVLENYYTPNQRVSLEYLGHNRYAIRYDCSGVTLYPGAVFPDPNGNVVGIHYQGWEPLSKCNDRSFNYSSDFSPNGNIAVFTADGYQINGQGYCEQRVHTLKREIPEQACVRIDAGYRVYSYEPLRRTVHGR